MSRLGIWRVTAAAFVGFLALAGSVEGAEPAERVFFTEPKDGAEVTSPVKVVMGVAGMTIKPSGGVVAGTGHHHVLINQGPMRGGKVIPTDKTHVHFGKGHMPRRAVQRLYLLQCVPGCHACEAHPPLIGSGHFRERGRRGNPALGRRGRGRNRRAERSST